MSSTRKCAPVVIIGAGPVGLITALNLARNGVESILVERGLKATAWPKMDVTNCRSMELLKRMGLADGLRRIGVAENYSFDVIFSAGYTEHDATQNVIAKWDLKSPAEWRRVIAQRNDGTLPEEPYQRCSQSLFEAWLREVCAETPLIKMMVGEKFDSLREYDDKVEATIINTETGIEQIVQGKYLVAADGASSRARKSAGIHLTGGPMPIAMFLVHFRSRDLTRIQACGQFWHVFYTSGAAIIAQDEKDTWTVHMPIGLDDDISKLDPIETIYKVLGGSMGPYKVKVDEILVTSSWRPNLCVADTYRSKGGRVFLAGDAAHQNIPMGGYGMNMGLGDAFDISWKLAAVLNGFGGEYLLESYEPERRPVAFKNVERSGVHMSVHRKYVEWVEELGGGALLRGASKEAVQLKHQIAQYLKEHDNENKDHGIEMDYRLRQSPIIIPDDDTKVGEPDWDARRYVPSTWPGHRAPYVRLSDGNTSIFDLYGLGYSIIDFTNAGSTARQFAAVAEDLDIPLAVIHLPDEPHARQIWERDAVLIRPDGYVAWRTPIDRGVDRDLIETVLLAAVGKSTVLEHKTYDLVPSTLLEKGAFTSSVGNINQDEGIAKMGEFQREVLDNIAS